MRIGLSTVYDNKLENMIMVYKDLWLPDERREDMSEYRIATENLRKLMSGDDSAVTNLADDNIFKACGKRVKIGLGKVLKEQGLFAPNALNGNVESFFKTPSANEIMVTQSGESVGDCALKEVKLIYESIELSDTYSQAATEYSDTDFPFEDISYIRPTNWGKDQTAVVEAINVPRRSMRAIVMLFKHADTVDSEKFVFPNIKRVDVTIDARPNAVYSNGIGIDYLYREATRIFHVKDTNMTETKFYNNKFALVVDLRCLDDNNAMGAGYYVNDTKAGVQLIITKEATTKGVKGEIYVLSDAAISVVGGSYSRLEHTNK